MTFVLAHRGFTGPEGGDPPPRGNTLRAFRAARRLGADGVELDVRRNADGELVVHHDAEVPGLGRLVTVRSRDMPADIPLLSDVLVACRGMLVDVEIKHDPGHDPGRSLALAAAGELARRAADVALLVSSFDAASLDVVGRAAPSLERGLLIDWRQDPEAGLVEAVRLGCSALHPFVTQVDAALVDRARGRGLRVNVWTVNAVDDLVNMVGLGVDAVITDRVPEALAAARARPSNGGAVAG